MSSSKKYNHYDRYLLKGKLRRNGFERWRYVFTGLNKTTGEQKTFFIELYYVNPQISPKETVIAQKFQLKINPSDLQYALAGTQSAENVSQEIEVLPSYALVKAGVYGANGKQINRFINASALSFIKSEEYFKVENCIFGHDMLSGEVALSESEAIAHPEYLCAAGTMDWNLHFEQNIESAPVSIEKNHLWYPCGVKTVFAGLVHLDGQEYAIVPRSSSGYIDKSWGNEYPDPFFHLSSSNLISVISGKHLTKSCFTVEGEFEKQLKIFIELEGQRFLLNKKSFFDKYTEIHNWTEMPEDADGVKLHWSVSIHKGKFVIDMDIFCKTAEMFVRDYELPQGQRTLLKILGGGTGFGEIRIYKKVGQNLELIEHANVLDAVCEYGTKEQIDK